MRESWNVFLWGSSRGQSGIDQRDAVATAHEHRVGDPEHAVELLGRNLERPRRWCSAGRRLRECGRACGVEGNAAFDLLRDLVDMTVEDGDRTESREQL